MGVPLGVLELQRFVFRFLRLRLLFGTEGNEDNEVGDQATGWWSTNITFRTTKLLWRPLLSAAGLGGASGGVEALDR